MGFSTQATFAEDRTEVNPRIASPKHKYNGLTYSRWSAKWFQHVNSFPLTHSPLTHSPLTDTADCSLGQKGAVWFIEGFN